MPVHEHEWEWQSIPNLGWFDSMPFSWPVAGLHQCSCCEYLGPYVDLGTKYLPVSRYIDTRGHDDSSYWVSPAGRLRGTNRNWYKYQVATYLALDACRCS